MLNLSNSEIDPGTADTNRRRSKADVIAGHSLEITAKGTDALRRAAALIAPNSAVSITYLQTENVEDRIAAAKAVRALGFEPIPHLSARRLPSLADFEQFVARLVGEADVRNCLVIAGDIAAPEGPFEDSLSVIATGLLERSGIAAVAVAGHPEGHPNMTADQCTLMLATKCDEIERRGMKPLIVTQFGFDADPFLAWLKSIRANGIGAPVRLGIPGPAGVKTLLQFAARCGVAASKAVMRRYGLSATRLLATAGPDRLVDALADRLQPEHGEVRLHFYPFGGLVRTAEWINAYAGRSPADS